MPFKTLTSAHNPYQTVVLTVGLAGELLETIVTGVPLLGGTPAKLDIGAVILDWVLVGPEPKPPSPSMRHPQAFGLRIAGLAFVPEDVAMVEAPFIMFVLVVLAVNWTV